MRIVLDLQAAQSLSKNTPIGEKVLLLTEDIIRRSQGHEIILVLNNMFPQTIESIRDRFDAILPQANIRVWEAVSPVSFLNHDNTGRRKAAEIIYEAFIMQLQPDFLLICNLFEGLMDDAVTSIGNYRSNIATGVLLHDYNTTVFQPSTVVNFNADLWYENKIAQLQRAICVFTWSKEVQEQAKTKFGFTDNNSTCLSDAAAEEILNFIELLVQLKKQEIDCSRRRKLAYFSPLPPVQSGISLYSSELIRELSRFYDIEVIVKQDQVDDLWIKANCPIRSVEWFMANYHLFDRIVYNMGNSQYHDYIYATAMQIPGITVMHDFMILDLLRHIEASTASEYGILGRNLYLSHGYKVACEWFRLNEDRDYTSKYPGNFSLLQSSLALIINSNSFATLAKELYGPQIADKFDVIPLWQNSDLRAQLSKDGQEFLQEHHNPIQCAKLYYDSIESAYSKQVIISDLCNAITSIDGLSCTDEMNLALADAIHHSLAPRITKRQLFVDISNVMVHNRNQGVIRVALNIMKELLDNPPHGYAVEPVYINHQKQYCYARNFTLDYLGCANQFEIEDELIAFGAGDFFFGLMLGLDTIYLQLNFYQKLRNYGVQVKFMLHDLLPVFMPQVFEKNTSDCFNHWLQTIIKTDGVICNSKSVADDFRFWASMNPQSLSQRFTIDWFHLGADIISIKDNYVLPASAQTLLDQLSKKISFITVSSIEPRKGHEQTLKAFEQLWAQGVDVNLVFVGRAGWMIDEFLKYIRNHKELNKRFFWLEEIDDAYLAEVYASCKCLIFASLGEGFGLSLIEAANYGLAIIARDIPIFQEVTQGHALFFKGTTPNALAETVQHWLQLFHENKHPNSELMKFLTWSESSERLKEIISSTEQKVALSNSCP